MGVPKSHAAPASSSPYDRVLATPPLPDDSTHFSDGLHKAVANTNHMFIIKVLHNPQLVGFYQDHCTYLPAMAGWFLFSALLSSYNKYVFGKTNLNFPCPLVLTSIHFCAQWIFSFSMCKAFPAYFGAQRVNEMAWSEFLGVSVPCGMVTSGDIGLSNLSMVTISISFYTMIKASTPVFVLLWAHFFGIVRVTWALCGVVLVIVVGEFLTVAGEVDFVIHGFLLCLMAAVLSGARWTLVQLKIQKLEPPLKTTVATMRVLSPFMFMSMVLVACVVERPWASLRGVIDSWETALYVLELGLLGAVLAICMIMCEFYLIMHSNAIVLMIGGVIKEILTIFIGVNFFGDTINRLNFIGCCVVFLGVILYKVVFHFEKEEEKAKNAVAMQKTASDICGLQNDEDDHRHDCNHPIMMERQPLHALQQDDESGMDGYRDDEDTGDWSTHHEGIEMRRAVPVRTSDGLGGKMKLMVV